MKKIAFFLTAVAVTLFSCEKEQDVTSTAESTLAGKKVTIKASHEIGSDPEAKTVLNDVDGSVTWAGDEVLKVVYQGSTNADVTSEASQAGETASFTFTTGDGNNYLVYPASIPAAYDGAKLTVTIPNDQDGTFANAAIEVAQYTGTPTCNLKNLGALLEITVDADVDEIVIYSNNSTPLVGTATVTIADGIPSVGDAIASGSTSVTLSGLSGAGTYYAAVLPGSYEAGIYVELKKDGTLVGERISGNTLAVARRQIKPLPVGNPGVIANKKFVTVSGAGGKDGSNWENAMDAAGFYTFLTTASTNVNVFMAAGTYRTQTIGGYTIKGGTTGLKVYGGYPSTASGTSLAGRDISNNNTILSGDQDGDGTGENRIIVAATDNITAVFDGLEFRNAYRKADGTKDIGSAIVVNNCSDMAFYNCIIADNENAVAGDAYGGGAVRAVNAAKLLFKGCTFRNNISASRGGVMRIAIGSNVTLDACVLEGNSANAGGAIYINKGTLTVKNGTKFNNNLSSTNGGAISVAPDATGCSVIISDARFFHNRAASSNGYCGGAIYISGTSSYPANVSITDSEFEENLGHASDLETSALKTGLSTSNKYTGGAIFVLQYTTLKLNHCRFYHNTCSRNGGAIRLRESSATLYANGCVFDTNYAGIGGTAISVIASDDTPSPSGVAALYNCVFRANVPKSGNAMDGTVSIYGECLIANSSVTVQSSYPGFNLLGTSNKSILVNNIVKNVTSEKPAVSVASGKAVSSYGHNIWSVLGGEGTVDNTNNSPSTDVVARASWSWVDPNLVVTTLPAAFYEVGTVDNRATVADVEAAIDAFDLANSTTFKTWLTSTDANALMVDVTGYTRATNKTTDKITPGSYQIR